MYQDVAPNHITIPQVPNVTRPRVPIAIPPFPLYNNKDVKQTNNITPQPMTTPTTHALVPLAELAEATALEREARRAAQQQIRNARYRDKVRAYKNLGTLPTERQKIRGMLLLCYPELEGMNPSELDSRIDQFIQSLLT